MPLAPSPRRRARNALLACAASLCWAACAPAARDANWEVVFRCPENAELAERMTLSVRRGSCQGDEVVPEVTFLRGDAEPRPLSPLAPGRYGFSVRVVGRGLDLSVCAEHELPTLEPVRLELGARCPEASGQQDASSSDGAGEDAGDAPPPRDAGESEDDPDAGAEPPPADAAPAPDGADSGEAGDRTCDVDCDDDNPCTEDRCESGECVNAPLNVTLGADGCDGVDCTVDDRCEFGECVGGSPDHTACDDDDACTDDLCIPGSGCSFRLAEDGSDCDDGLDCTEEDRCESGECVGTLQCEDPEACGPVPGTCSPCVSDAQCDDGSQCTVGTCSCNGGDCENGFCTFTELEDGTECDDGLDCTTGVDVCRQGRCEGQARADCPVDNPCVIGSCLPGRGCAYAPLEDGAACDDGLACTASDVCIQGVCRGQDTCDDENPCVANVCKPGGCEAMFLDRECDDGLSCTTLDRCESGECVGQVACDDEQPCTDDLCQEAGDVDQCTHEVRSGACEDGRSCTSGDYCEAGVCVSGAESCGANASCGAIECMCDEGYTACSGDCVDLASDASNCGACGQVCAGGAPCQQSRCLEPGCRTFALGGHRYMACPGGRSWEDARIQCRGWGGDLAVLESDAESAALAAELPMGTFWLGGHDRGDADAEEVWRWVVPGGGEAGTVFYQPCRTYLLTCGGVARGEDLHPDAFDDWASGEPNDSGLDGEDCLGMAVPVAESGSWNDLPCERPYGFVCESD